MRELPNLPNLDSLRKKTYHAVGQKSMLEKNLEEMKKEIKQLESQREELDLVATLFRELIDQEIMESVSAVEKIQTEGLQAVFNDQDLKVKSKVDINRGKVSVSLNIEQKTEEGHLIVGLSKDSFGGSVLTVQSVILRVLVAMKHGLRPFFLFDESLPAFDDHYIVNMVNFLKTMCDDLSLDMLFVTHNDTLFDNAQNSYRIKRVNGASKFIGVQSEE